MTVDEEEMKKKSPPDYEDQGQLMVKRPPSHEDREQLMMKRQSGHEDQEQLMMKRLPGHGDREQMMCCVWEKNVRPAAIIVQKICLRNFSEKSSEESKNCPFKMSVESNTS
jgi:hypothetical protein